MKKTFLIFLCFSLIVSCVFAFIGTSAYFSKQDMAYSDSFSAELYELKTTMGDLYLNIDLYEEDKAELEEGLEALLDEQSAIQEEIEAGDNTNASRLDELELEIESTNEELAEIETAITQIENKIAEIETKVNELYSKVDEMQRNILTAYVADYVENNGAEITLTLTSGVKVGSKLSVSGGKVVVGSGVSKVLVSGVILFKDMASTAATRYGSLLKNGSACVDARSYCESGGLAQLVFSPVVCSVSNGTTFTFNFKGANSEIYASGSSSLMKTYLTVEVVE